MKIDINKLWDRANEEAQELVAVADMADFDYKILFSKCMFVRNEEEAEGGNQGSGEIHNGYIVDHNGELIESNLAMIIPLVETDTLLVKGIKYYALMKNTPEEMVETAIKREKQIKKEYGTVIDNSKLSGLFVKREEDRQSIIILDENLGKTEVKVRINLEKGLYNMQFGDITFYFKGKTYGTDKERKYNVNCFISTQ